MNFHDQDAHARSLRASDADRERVVSQLKSHVAAGRISTDELSERLGVVYGARTLGEVESTLLDLPGAVAVAPAPAERWPAVRVTVVTCAVLAALVAVPALVSTGFALLVGLMAIVFSGVVLLVPLVVVIMLVWGIVRLLSREPEPTRPRLQ